MSPREGARAGRTRSSGPLCESSDIFGRDRRLPPLEVDDVMAILDAGAYGSVMASTYNRRPLLPEVLIDERTDVTITKARRHEGTMAKPDGTGV